MLEIIFKKHNKLILIFIFILSITIRFWFLPNANINFGFDQARDAFVAKEIIDGDIKIQGPATNSIPGLHQGVLFYYLVTPAFYFGGGSPIIATYFMALLNAITVLPVFYLTYLLTKKYVPAFIAAILFTTSFDALVFSSFLSNVSPAILFIPIMLTGLYLWIKKNKFGPIITGVFWGLSVQCEVAFCFYLLPIIFWLYKYRKNISIKSILIASLSFILAVSTMILCELKFSFPAVKSLAYLLSGKDGVVQGAQFGEFLLAFINQSGTRIANLIFPFNVALGALLGFSAIVYSFIDKKLKSTDFNWSLFLVTFIFAALPALPFGGSTSPYIMIGTLPLMAVFLSIFLWKTFNRNRVVILIIVLLISFLGVSKFVIKNRSDDPDYFTKDYLISKELQIIDYTYEKAEGKPFSISTLTMPLYVNTLWSYLYNWYGMEKYGYLPAWRGKDQVGLPGNNLVKADNSITKHFFITEPATGIPSMWIEYAYGDQDSVSKVIDQKKIGNMTVEERELLRPIR